MEIEQITNANVYVDNEGHIGHAAEVKLPEIAVRMTEHMALGMIGTLKLPSGLEPLSMSIKWNGFYASKWKKALNPFAVVPLKILANVELYDGSGRLSEKSLAVTVRGKFEKAGLPALKGQEKATSDDEIAVEYLKIEFDGEEIVEIDVAANIWRANGVDLLAQFRTNIGA